MAKKKETAIRYLTRDVCPSTGKERKDKPYGRQGDQVRISSVLGGVIIVERIGGAVTMPLVHLNDQDRPPFLFPCPEDALSIEGVGVSEARKLELEKLSKPVTYKKNNL